MAIIDGTSEPDVIDESYTPQGSTEDADVIQGLGGADTLKGLGGADQLFGGNGSDVVKGAAGADILHGDERGDFLYGGTEDDEVYGGDGGDTLIGEDGNDLLDGGVGADILGGALGDDEMRGGDGSDLLFGFDGADTAYGGKGSDRVVGGEDNDILYGGDGDDSGVLPKFLPDPDAETLEGGLTPELQAQFEAYAGLEDLSDIENLVGGVFGGGGDDVIHGDGGSDRLEGGDGSDVIDGGTGSDTLVGGLGKDSLTGGPSDDSFLFNVAAGKANMDVIEDFEPGRDKILLDDAIFASIGPKLAKKEFLVGKKAGDANDYVIYNQKKGNVAYDADGNGAASRSEIFAKVDRGTDLDHKDFLIV